MKGQKNRLCGAEDPACHSRLLKQRISGAEHGFHILPHFVAGVYLSGFVYQRLLFRLGKLGKMIQDI